MFAYHWRLINEWFENNVRSPLATDK